jgi:hypothetical protein
MKIITLVSFSILLFSSCAAKKALKGNMEFAITDKSINDNSFLTLLISDKTASNYWLPIITSPESEKWQFLLRSDEVRFFFTFITGFNAEGKEMNWISEQSDHGDWTELEKYTELWDQKKKAIGVNDLILLKSGESIKIKVPIHLTLKITKDFVWELENYKNEKSVQIAIHYPEKRLKHTSKFLEAKVIKQLKTMKYRLYRPEINSNKVPLILK